MYTNWEERKKNYLRWHDYLCRKSQRINKNSPEVINYYSKVAGYNQYAHIFLFIINEQMKLEI